MTRTDPQQEADDARRAFRDLGSSLTPEQSRALKHAFEAGVRVAYISHPTLGEPSFLVFRPVPPELAEELDLLVQEGLEIRKSGAWPHTRYVTHNRNFPEPYWDLEF